MAAGEVQAVTDTRRGIAVYGGSFNPPHRTHQRICEAALEQLPVDELRLLPAGDHPHKRGDRLAPAAHRLAMCRIAFADLDRVVIDDREMRRPGMSFTVTTLEELRLEHPGRELWFVIGADNLPLLPTWKDHHRILSLAHVATFPREGCPIDGTSLEGVDLTADERAQLLAHRLRLEPDSVSASELRARIARGEQSLRDLDPRVEDYIRLHGLYAG